MKVWNVTEQDIREAAEASSVAIWGDYHRGSPWAPSGGIMRDGRALNFRLALTDKRVREGFEERERDDEGRFIGKRRLYPLVWQRASVGSVSGWQEGDRRIASVCWHGHYAFMRYLLALRPDARIKTGRFGANDYHGLEGFKEYAIESGYHNIGSRAYPVQLREACYCADHGMDYLTSIDRSADEWASAMRAKFRIQEITETTEFADDGSEDYSTTYGVGAWQAASFGDALDMLEAGCWDNLEWGADDVVCYPADHRQDYRTGGWIAEQLVIVARRSEWMTRLADMYYARQNQKVGA